MAGAMVDVEVRGKVHVYLTASACIAVGFHRYCCRFEDLAAGAVAAGVVVAVGAAGVVGKDD